MVHVDDPGIRGGRLGYLMSVAGGGQPGADVQELAHAALGGEEPRRPG
jgi:hypothetical protein